MILGIDPGSVRVGVAVADAETRFARPLEVIDTATIDAVVRIAELIDEHGAREVVVGLPVGLSGRRGPAVEVQQAFIARLREAVSVPVVEHDERLTTVLADQGLRAGGGKAGRRASVKDAVAAQIMLQGYLDATSRRDV